MGRFTSRRGGLVWAAIMLALAATPAHGHALQAGPLAELLAIARDRSPEIEAARRAAAAAEARVPQAGALPDPMVSAGLMYVPVPAFDLSAEGMTMFSLQVSQRVPVPGSRALREEAAAALHRAALREVEAAEVRVAARLAAAYHELVFAEEAARVVKRNRALVEDLAEVTAGRLAVGHVPQQDVLRAQTEVSRLEAQLAGLRDQHSTALAEINAVLDRDPDTPVEAEYPGSIRRLVLAAPPPGAFTAAALEEGLGEGFPSLQALQAQALRTRPDLRAHEERIGAMSARHALTERERWPDLEWMLAYSPRSGRSDMVSARVSLALPLFRERKQAQAVVEAEEVLAEHRIRHHELVAELRAEVARRHHTLVRSAERAHLLEGAVLPQARATVESALGAYQAGRLELAGVLEAQATLFRNEIELARLLADFGSELAALQAAVGTSIEEMNR